MENLDLSQYYGKDFSYKAVPKELKGSARAQGISERAKLNSSDGYIIDEHDQFYKDHKLLLKLFLVRR